MLLFDFSMFILCFAVRVIRKQIEDATYQTERSMTMLFIIAFTCCLLHLSMVDTFLDFGSSQDGLCREQPLKESFFDKMIINSLYIPFMGTLIYDYYRIKKVGKGMVDVILHVFTSKIKKMIILMLSILSI